MSSVLTLLGYVLIHKPDVRSCLSVSNEHTASTNILLAVEMEHINTDRRKSILDILLWP
jgi:hypothetical protein